MTEIYTVFDDFGFTSFTTRKGLVDYLFFNYVNGVSSPNDVSVSRSRIERDLSEGVSVDGTYRIGEVTYEFAAMRGSLVKRGHSAVGR